MCISKYIHGTDIKRYGAKIKTMHHEPKQMQFECVTFPLEINQIMYVLLVKDVKLSRFDAHFQEWMSIVFKVMIIAMLMNEFT